MRPDIPAQRLLRRGRSSSPRAAHRITQSNSASRRPRVSRTPPPPKTWLKSAASASASDASMSSMPSAARLNAAHAGYQMNRRRQAHPGPVARAPSPLGPQLHHRDRQRVRTVPARSARKACGPPVCRARRRGPARAINRSSSGRARRRRALRARRCENTRWTTAILMSKKRILPTCDSHQESTSAPNRHPLVRDRARSRSTTGIPRPADRRRLGDRAGPAVAAPRSSRPRTPPPRSRSSPRWCCSAPASGNYFPAADFGAHFLRAGIGFEVMDTGAACRTFNVLVAEHRRVVALLF